MTRGCQKTNASVWRCHPTCQKRYTVRTTSLLYYYVVHISLTVLGQRVTRVPVRKTVLKSIYLHGRVNKAVSAVR